MWGKMRRNSENSWQLAGLQLAGGGRFGWKCVFSIKIGRVGCTWDEKYGRFEKVGRVQLAVSRRGSTWDENAVLNKEYRINQLEDAGTDK